MTTHQLIVDLRSDTVTKPTPEMYEAMRAAELGDDVLGDDPTVKALEGRVADLLGKEASCFVPSGTMSNQACVHAQTTPGDEIVAHEHAHVYVYEGGAWAAISGCSIHLVRGDGGIFTGEDVRAAVREENDHFPRTRLVCVENTHNRGGGTVWPMDRLREVTDVSRELGLRTHLDGARLWNAHVATRVPLDELARGFDTVSVCFSKGLGAPVGSASVGDEETIRRVRRIRKMLGGAMRQSGVLASAALFALEHNIPRLAEDQDNAHTLASALDALPGLRCDPSGVETNIVYADVDPDAFAGGPSLLVRDLESRGVRVMATGPRTIRAVTSLMVDREGVERACEAFREAVSGLAV